MVSTTPQIKKIETLAELDIEDRNKRALELLKETRILNIAKLANMLVDLFGLDEGFEKVGKREGNEIGFV